MAKVKLARDLRWGGAPHAKGNVLDVDDATAERWAKNGLATKGAKKAVVAGRLPPDFPGYHALMEADILTLDQARAVEDFTSLHGIGPATAADIKEALKN